MMDQDPRRKNLGPGGMCVCKKCGYSKKHEFGKPCFRQKCPKCGATLVRSA